METMGVASWCRKEAMILGAQMVSSLNKEGFLGHRLRKMFYCGSYGTCILCVHEQQSSLTQSDA